MLEECFAGDGLDGAKLSQQGLRRHAHFLPRVDHATLLHRAEEQRRRGEKREAHERPREQPGDGDERERYRRADDESRAEKHVVHRSLELVADERQVAEDAGDWAGRLPQADGH